MKAVFSFFLLSSLFMGSTSFASIFDHSFDPVDARASIKSIYKLQSGPSSCFPKMTVINAYAVKIPEINFCRTRPVARTVDGAPEVGGGSFIGSIPGIDLGSHRSSNNVIVETSLTFSADGQKLAYVKTHLISENGSITGPVKEVRSVCVYKLASVNPYPLNGPEPTVREACAGKNLR
jgi:hypothetical protein